MSELQSIAQHAIESAKKYGAQNATATISRKQSLSIKWRKGIIEDIKSAGDSSLYIELFVDGRYGAFNSSDLRHDSLDDYIHNAIEMARLLEEEPARTLPDPALYANQSDVDLELYDPEVAKLTPNDLIEKCRTLEAECQKFTDLSIFDISTSYNLSLGELYKINTNGFEGSKQTSNISGSCSITVTDGEKKTAGDAWHSARHSADLHKPDAIAGEAAQNCRYHIGATKLDSKKRTIILDRNNTEFLYYFLRTLDGYSFVDKESYFMDRIGQTIGSPLLDIHDMPFIKRGSGSRLFDSEGISTKELTLFEHGQLKQIYLDTYCANKLNMKPTSGNMTNVVLTPGKRSCEEIIADVKDGIYVIGLIGGNSDRSQGDFSYGIFGVAIENGKLTKNVSEMNISGNFLELWKKLTEVGNDPRDDDDFVMPTLRIDDVSTSGS